ncbi:hypothetical protein BJ742DRAFT_766883 [Cladochytrium replicatum]|nr:hypothetical protein BJ742DRAFT_766883 [Cladochytrium replicatum]
MVRPASTVPSVASALPKNPHLIFLAACVGAGAVGGVYVASHFIRNDPHVVVVNRTANPHKWNDINQTTSFKLYTVAEQYEKAQPKGLKSVLEKSA